MTELLRSPQARRYLFRGTLQGLLGLTVLALIALAITLSMTPGTQAQVSDGPAPADTQPAREISPSVYSHVQKLRRDATLTAYDMAALGMTQADSEAVLTRLVDWCEQNEQQLAASQRAVYAAQRDLEDLNRKIRTGQASDFEMRDFSTKAQAVQTARDSLKTLKTNAVRDAMRVSVKSTDWERAAAVPALPKGAPRNLRYVRGMDANRLSSLMQQAKARRTTLDKELSFNEQREIEQVQQRVAMNLALIGAAEEQALPLPEELREDEGFVFEDSAE